MKYILKKEYPGSPKLDSTVEIKNNGGYELENSTSYFMTKDKVENYPEFWEEVVEKDYEILELSLQRSIKHQIVSALENSEDYTISLLSCNGNKIHSVKRLSDGEIFTIGDKVVGYNNSIAKIKTIDLVGEISLNIGTDKHEGFSLKNLKKIKQPLFTTEDGVDIFEDDEVVCFDKEDWITRNEKYKFQPFDVKDKNYLFFSTKEKAEEYILYNKPCLSLKDVASIYISADKPITDITSFSAQNRRIQDLVKSKIQQSV